MIITFSTKHTKESTPKLAKCSQHENNKILKSHCTGGSGFPLLIKESNKIVLDANTDWDMIPDIHQASHYCDTYKEMPAGTVIVFTQTNSEV